MTNSTPAPQALNMAVEFKTSYGRECIYPADDNAILFAELLGQKTFTMANIEAIKKLGYIVFRVAETGEL